MNRIKEIAKLCNGYKTIVDFGCDHGLTIKHAIDNYGVLSAIAVDNKLAPLSRAKKNLVGYNVTFIQASKISQMQKFLHKNFIPDLIIITGLGASTILSIIDQKIKTTYLVSSHSKNSLLRKFLVNNNFKIIDEKIIKEDNIYYEIILFKVGKMTLTEKELHTGIFLKNNQLYQEYASYKISKYQKILEVIPLKRQQEIQKLISFWQFDNLI